MVEGDDMISFGIMQGRFTPSNGRGIQFFPFDNWEQEFKDCAELGLNEIEWIFDYDRFDENPLWSHEGRQLLKCVIEGAGVKIRSVCFDYFMRRPFHKQPVDAMAEVGAENMNFIKEVFDGMKSIGSSLLEIPMVDDSSIKTDEERKRVVDFLCEVLDLAKEYDVDIGCETDMPVGVFRDFLNEVKITSGSNRIFANYDSGNSSGLGYDHKTEIESLGEYIYNVHIKDRVLHGTTVALGTGSADFDAVFSSLKKVGYKDSILLQAARGTDGDEKNNIRKQMKFVKDYCVKYGLE